MAKDCHQSVFALFILGFIVKMLLIQTLDGNASTTLGTTPTGDKETVVVGYRTKAKLGSF